MKIISRTSFKSLAIAAAMLAAGVAYAQGQTCGSICAYYAQQAYNATYANTSAQMTAYCNSLTDPNAKAACLSSVPAYAQSQAQQAYNTTASQCGLSCHG